MNQGRTRLPDRLRSPQRWRLRLAAFLLAAVAASGVPLTPASAATPGHYRAWGDNKFGTLGDGTGFYAPSSSPRAPLLDSGGWSDIDSGGYHTVALKSDGTVWTWGDNQFNQLGDGAGCVNFVNCTSDSPVPVFGLTDVVEIAGGLYHSMALKSDGTVWTWGDNAFGQLGNDTNCTSDPSSCTSSTPVQVKALTGTGNLTGVSHISAGFFHSLVTVGTGTTSKALAWGRNDVGQLGDNTTINRLRPVEVKGVGGSGTLTDVAQVAAGSIQSAALHNNGSVVGWGGNSNGQVGDGTNTNTSAPVRVLVDGTTNQLTGVAQIDSGGLHTLARKQDGTAVAWGLGESGQLGNGSVASSSKAKAVSGLTGVADVAGGAFHSLALKSDGTVVAFGDGGNGALGNGCIIDGDPLDPTSCKAEEFPVAVTNLSGVSEVGAGYTHSLAVVS